MSRPISQSHKTRHRYALTRLSSYMDGQLTARERAHVRAHLDTCPDCRKELRTLRWTQDLTQQMPVLPVPRSFIVREVDLEHRGIAQPRPRFARALAGLQAAAAIVAVLLVLVVAGDRFFVGTGSSLNESDSAIARQTLGTQIATVPAEAAPKAMLDETAVDQEAQEPKIQLESALAVAEETATEPVRSQVQPTPEPSPTWTTRPTQTPTTAGFTGEGTSTKRSSTPQPTQTATTAPTDTLTIATVPTIEPTATPVQNSEAEPAPPPDPQQIAEVPKAMTQASTDAEESQAWNPIPPSEETNQKLGRRVAQAGLGVVLVGLLIAIVWLRLKRRTG